MLFTRSKELFKIFLIISRRSFEPYLRNRYYLVWFYNCNKIKSKFLKKFIKFVHSKDQRREFCIWRDKQLKIERVQNYLNLWLHNLSDLNFGWNVCKLFLNFLNSDHTLYQFDTIKTSMFMKRIVNFEFDNYWILELVNLDLI